MEMKRIKARSYTPQITPQQEHKQDINLVTGLFLQRQPVFTAVLHRFGGGIDKYQLQTTVLESCKVWTQSRVSQVIPEKCLVWTSHHTEGSHTSKNSASREELPNKSFVAEDTLRSDKAQER